MTTQTQSATTMAAPRATQARIHLSTRNSDLELPQDTGSILVSTEFRRYQLSTLVNRLLDTETPIPLEFLVNGEFLRTSLDEFLTQNGISAETTLNVEYVKALIPPVHVASYEHDEWVSSVDVLSSSSRAAQWSSNAGVHNRILSGSFDGLLRVWNTSSEVVATGQGHTDVIHDVKFFSPTQIVTASLDRTLRVWKYSDAGVGPDSVAPALELYGHSAAVNRLAVHAPSSRILSAAADHSVGIWTPRKSEASSAPENLLPTANKRRKLSNAHTSAPQRGSLAIMSGHKGSVSDVCFDENDPTVAYSTSLDHSVKTWDLVAGTAVDTKTVADSLCSVCHLPEQSLLAAGSALGYISLVDPRATAARVSAMTLRGHTNMVSSLARDPNSSYQLVSASHDSTCRIWDIRSSRNEIGAEKVSNSVFVLERQSTKGQKPEQGNEMRVFSVCWDRDVGIVSGGRDKMVQINQAST